VTNHVLPGKCLLAEKFLSSSVDVVRAVVAWIVGGAAADQIHFARSVGRSLAISDRAVRPKSAAYRGLGLCGLFVMD